MKKFLKSIMAVLAVSVAAGGCIQPEPPVNTSTGMNGLQQRALTVRNIGEEFGATYDDVWYSAIAALQLNGFMLRQADKNSGSIYGVWLNTYEMQSETTEGGFFMTQLSASPSYYAGGFVSRTQVFKQIEVSVTLEPLAEHQTLVRLVARFDSDGEAVAEGVFANRFFGVLRKEIFLRKNGGSIYTAFAE